MLRYVTALALLSMLLTGCFSHPQSLATTPRKDSTLVIEVDWGHFSSPQTMGVMTLSSTNSGSEEATHVGARLVYPDEGAAFTQSKERKRAEQDGVISMRVPASPSAKLFVVAVREGDGGFRSGRVVRFGSLTDIVIAEDTTLVVGMDDISWTNPHWEFIDEAHEASATAGTFTANRNDYELTIPVSIHDPFQPGETLDYSSLLIGLATSNGGAEPGFTDASSRAREFNVSCKNPHRGNEQESTCWFGPYLKGDRFNLPTGYYLPPVINEFTIIWE